jgi:hypothetical protein
MIFGDLEGRYLSGTPTAELLIKMLLDALPEPMNTSAVRLKNPILSLTKAVVVEADTSLSVAARVSLRKTVRHGNSTASANAIFCSATKCKTSWG